MSRIVNETYTLSVSIYKDEECICSFTTESMPTREMAEYTAKVLNMQILDVCEISIITKRGVIEMEETEEFV